MGVPSKRDVSEESSDDGMEQPSGDDEKEFVSSLKSLATSPQEKKPMAKNSARGLEKVNVARPSVQSNKPETKKSSFFVGGESEDDSGGDEEEEGGHQPWQPARGRGEGFFSKKAGEGEFTGGRGQGRGKDSRGPVRVGAGLPEDANLHPSWQAK